MPRPFRMCFAGSWKTAVGVPAGARASDVATGGSRSRICANTSAVCLVRTSGLLASLIEIDAERDERLRFAPQLRDAVVRLADACGVVGIIGATFCGDAVSNQIQLQRCHVSGGLRGLRARGSDIFTDRPRGAVRRATISVRTVCVDSRSVSSCLTYLPCGSGLFFDPAWRLHRVRRERGPSRGLRLHRGSVPLQHLEVVQPSWRFLRALERAHVQRGGFPDRCRRRFPAHTELLRRDPHLVQLFEMQLAGVVDSDFGQRARSSAAPNTCRRAPVQSCRSASLTERSGVSAYRRRRARVSSSIVSRFRSRSSMTCNRTS